MQEFLMLLMHAAFTTHLTLLNVISLIIFSEQYGFVCAHVTRSVLRPSILTAHFRTANGVSSELRAVSCVRPRTDGPCSGPGCLGPSNLSLLINPCEILRILVFLALSDS